MLTIASPTSGHHDLHNLVQAKDSHIAQLNQRLLTVLKEKEDALQQLKITSHQQPPLMSSQKTTGTSYCNYQLIILCIILL